MNNWISCTNCKNIFLLEEWIDNLKVCPYCGTHHLFDVDERISSICDEHTFHEINENIYSADPLKFGENTPVSYKDKLELQNQKNVHKNALITGIGEVEGREIALAIHNFHFLGGSLGSVVGEKLVRLVDHASKHHLPLVIISSSGGARMQEGTLSLMQMVKTTQSIKKFKDEGNFFLSILTHPTTGGVAASYASLGDIVIAEKDALIGFAGPRVIKQTLNEDLPEQFQKANFMLEHGLVDKIIERKNMRNTISNILSYVVYYKGEL